MFYNLFTSELSSNQEERRVSCCVNFRYADDMVLVASSLSALQKLLYICSHFLATMILCGVQHFKNC